MEVIELPLLTSTNNLVSNYSAASSPFKFSYSPMSMFGLNDGRSRTISQCSDLIALGLDDLPGELNGGPYADMVDPSSDVYKAIDYDLTRHFCDFVSDSSPIFLPIAPLSSPKHLSPLKRTHCDLSTQSGSFGMSMLVPASKYVTNSNISSSYNSSSSGIYCDGKESDDEIIVVDSPMTSPLPPPQLVAPTDSDSDDNATNLSYSSFKNTNTAISNQKRRRITVTPSIIKRQIQQPAAASMNKKVIRLDASKLRTPCMSRVTRLAPSVRSANMKTFLPSTQCKSIQGIGNRRRRNQANLVARHPQYKNIGNWQERHAMAQASFFSHEENLPPISVENLEHELRRFPGKKEMNVMPPLSHARVEPNNRKKLQLLDKVPNYLTTQSDRRASVGLSRQSNYFTPSTRWNEFTPMNISSAGSCSSTSSSSCQASPTAMEDFRATTTSSSDILECGMFNINQAKVQSVTVRPGNSSPTIFKSSRYFPPKSVRAASARQVYSDLQQHTANEDDINTRKIIFVGRLPKTWADPEVRLRRILSDNNLGPVRNVVVHQRFNQHLDTFAFLYFLHRRDAYSAYDFFQRSSEFKNLNVGFGGRLGFLRGQEYTDYDGVAGLDETALRRPAPANDRYSASCQTQRDELESSNTAPRNSSCGSRNDDFEDMLRSYQQLQRKRHN